MLKSGLLKLGALKAWPVAFPLGVIVLGAIWVRRSRPAPPPSASQQLSAATPADEAKAGRHATPGRDAAVHGARHQHPGHAANTARPEPSTPRGIDREALLSRIIDDNVRLREALK